MMKVRIKEGEKMTSENKLVLSDFINGDRFELNSYLNYLLNQFHTDVRDRSEDIVTKNKLTGKVN